VSESDYLLEPDALPLCAETTLSDDSDASGREDDYPAAWGSCRAAF